MINGEQKLIVRILEALELGGDTSGEIGEMLNHPSANISAMLSEMQDSGLVKKTGRFKWVYGKRGKRKAYCYERATA